MFSIQPIGLLGRDEKLTRVGILSRIGRTEHPGLTVLVDKVFIGKVGPIDASLTCAITLDKVSTLNHEILNDTMERAVLVPRGLFVYQEFTGTQLTKVFTCPWALCACIYDIVLLHTIHGHVHCNRKSKVKYSVRMNGTNQWTTPLVCVCAHGRSHTHESTL